MPNFSTKSEGMGLGLAMVKSIAESHGGAIWFESYVGTGTTFFFELPVYNE
jgi:signal transduction histidine kinase